MVNSDEKWNENSLDELVESKTIGLVKSAKEQDPNFEFDYVKMHNISNDNSWFPVKIARVNATENELEKYSLKDGDLLFNTRNSFELVGKSCLYKSTSEKTAVFNNNIMRIRFKPEINQRFAAYAFCSSQVLNQLESMKQGTTNVSAIYYKTLKDLRIKYPPIPEQKRIVALLDTVFADLEETRAKAKQNLKNARELFDSYLQQVFSNNHKGWVTTKLKAITSKIGSGATPKGGKAAYKTEGMSLIRSMNVHDRLFKKKDLALIDDEQATKLNNVEVLPKDVLLNITGASVARCCVVPEEYLPARVNQHVSIIRVNENTIKPELLCFLLTSKYYKDILLGIGEAGSTRQAITKVQIENFEVSYPESVGNQDEFIRQLTSLENDVLKLNAIYTKRLEALDELKKSILQKAFSGELTKAVKQEQPKDILV